MPRALPGVGLVPFGRRRVQEGGERAVGLAVIEPGEHVGRLAGPAREIPLGAQDQPAVAVIRGRLEVRLQLGEGPGEVDTPVDRTMALLPISVTLA